mgnify:CR=1 FL=1
MLSHGTISYAMGGWAAPWGIEYRIDTMNAYVALIVTGILVVGLSAYVLVTKKDFSFMGGALSMGLFLLFGLIVVGFLPLSIFALKDLGGWSGLRERLDVSMAHTWKGLPAVDPGSATMDGVGTVLGLAFVLSFGYWCTNFLVVQRAMAAGSMSAARKTPLIGAMPKMFLPLLVVGALATAACGESARVTVGAPGQLAISSAGKLGP